MSLSRGSRNLFILGIGALIIAGTSTAVSLALYRMSGDIYLDRSRPGYLPDQAEVEEDSDAAVNFSFSESGNLTDADLEDYLSELDKIIQRLTNFADPYAPNPLSDESLGIPSELSED